MTTAVVFAYSEVGMRCLRVLLRHGFDVQKVFSHEDDPAELRWYGSVAEVARENHLALLTPTDPNVPMWINEVAQLRPDFLFSFYYRHLLCDELLATARQGALNMHGSLLPKYRGRAPVNWAIIHGESETGASLHYMHSKPDAGPLVAQERVPIAINDTGLDVSLKVARAAESLLDRCLPDLIDGRATAKPLDLASGSYFGRRRPEDGRIRWNAPAMEIHNLIRAVAPPFPGAFATHGAHTFRLLGSVYRGERVRFQQSAPCLYVDDLGLHLDCVDGQRLHLTHVELDGDLLMASSFVARCGTTPYLLQS